MSDDFQSPPPAPPVTPSVGDEYQAPAQGDTGLLLAGLGYIFWIPAVIALFLDPYKDSKWIRKHAIQAIALGLAISIVTSVTTPFLIGLLIGPAAWVYAIILGIKAFKGESFDVPLITGLVKNWV